MHRRVNRIEAQLRKENVLPQFQFFSDPPRKLPRDTKRREIARFARLDGVQIDGAAARRVQPVRAAIFPAKTTAEFADGIEVSLEVGKRKIARRIVETLFACFAGRSDCEHARFE